MRRSSQLRRLVAVPLMVLLIAATVSPAIATDNVVRGWTSQPANGYDHWVRWGWDPVQPEPQAFRDYIWNGTIEWNKVGRELYFAYDSGSSQDILVSYEDLLAPNQDMLAIASYMYWNEEIIDGKIAFNRTPGDYEHWYGQAPLACNYVDAWSTAAHEFGHLVALNHSGPADDTMHPFLWCGDTSQRTLTTHDMDGIRALYPAN